MIVRDPIAWLIDRLEHGRPFFNLRFNDGEQILIFKILPETYIMSDSTRVFHDQGAALEVMLREMAAGTSHPDDLLLGCSWWCEPDDLCHRFVELLDSLDMLERFRWCHPHYFLPAVVDGTVFRLLDVLRKAQNVVLVTNDQFAGARHCLGADLVLAPRSNSWLARSAVYEACVPYAREERTFVWCAGGGVKPAAWNLYRAFPRTSHLDLGHLFDGVFGVEERSWLKDPGSPYHAAYFGGFMPYVRRFVP